MSKTKIKIDIAETALLQKAVSAFLKVETRTEEKTNN